MTTRKMTMAEKSKTRAHMRSAGLDPMNMSPLEFINYAKKHGFMASDDNDGAEKTPLGADGNPDMPESESESEGSGLDDFDDSESADDEGESDGDDDEADDEGESDGDDEGESDDEADDEAPEPPPEPPEPSNPVEQMIDDRVAAHIASHTHDDTHRLTSKQTSKLVAKIKRDVKKAMASEAKKKIRSKREKTHVSFDHTHSRFNAIAACIERNHNVYLHGPAGAGKTTLGKQLAQVFKLDFYMIGRVDDIFSLTGYTDATGTYVPTDFYKAFTQGGLFLGDELDRWAPEALTGLNAATANGFMAFPDGLHTMHEDFVFIGAGNTLGKGHDRIYTAAQALDGSTTNRYTKIELPYDEQLERKLALAMNADAGHWVDFVQRARRNAERHRMDLIISPRDAINGADLLAAGFNVKAVKEMTFMAGLSTNERNQLEA